MLPWQSHPTLQHHWSRPLGTLDVFIVLLMRTRAIILYVHLLFLELTIATHYYFYFCQLCFFPGVSFQSSQWSDLGYPTPTSRVTNHIFFCFSYEEVKSLYLLFSHKGVLLCPKLYLITFVSTFRGNESSMISNSIKYSQLLNIIQTLDKIHSIKCKRPTSS